MKKFEGKLDTVSVQELLRWVESAGKTGSLTLCHEGITKTFYFQKGQLVFASSQKEGERTGEFFTARCGLDRSTLYQAIKNSSQLQIPFTEYLISKQIVDKDTLTAWISLFVETLLADTLHWQTGTFTFTGELPAAIINGPVRVHISAAMTGSLKDIRPESNQEGFTEVERIFNQIVQKITANNIDLPVIPDMTYKLRTLMQNERSSLHDIARLIMSDQVLTSKILKVANSVFYSSMGRSTSLQQAMITMGFNTVQSIATVHALNSFNKQNTPQIKEVLSHSLLCAFIAQKTAADIGLDPEEFFVCSLLHDIGKTVLLNITADYAFPKEMVEALLERYHQHVGSLLVLKWNFSEVIGSAVLYHHNPWDAPSNRKIAEAVMLSDTLAHGATDVENLRPKLRDIDPGKLDLRRLRKDIKVMTDTVSSLQHDL